MECVNFLIEDHINIRIDGGSASQTQFSSKHETPTNLHVWIFDILRSQFNCETLCLTQYKPGDNLQPAAQTNIDSNGGNMASYGKIH